MKNYCIDCRKKISKNAKRCRKCANIGDKNPNYKHGLTNKKSYCIDCGKKLAKRAAWHNSKRCISCSRIGEHNSNYKCDDYCIDHFCECGKKISLDNFLYGCKKCRSCTSKEMWLDEKYRNKTQKAAMLGALISPNKPETILINLFKKLKIDFDYVGDGKLILNGLCPDFVNKKNKKIIELYGDYWHGVFKQKITDKKRIKIYKNHGYSTSIIWEHELKDLNKVINKIKRFINA